MKRKETILIVILIVFGLVYQANRKVKSFKFWYGFKGHDRAARLVSEPLHEFPEIEKIAANVQLLRVNNLAGDMQFSPSQDKDVHILATVQVYHHDQQEAGIIAKTIHVHYPEPNNEAAISVSADKTFPYDRVRVHFAIAIPSSCQLDIDSRYGDISIKECGQNIHVFHRDGDLHVENIASPLNIETKNGAISLKNINEKVELTLNDNTLTAEKIAAIKINSRRSELHCNDIAGLCELICSNDQVFIDHIGSLDMNGEHVEIHAANVQNGVNISNSHQLISLSDVHGNITLSTRDCNIILNRIEGNDVCIKNAFNDINISDLVATNADIQNRSGEIIIAALAIKERLNIDSNHGNINLNLPKTLIPALTLKSLHGDIDIPDYHVQRYTANEETTVSSDAGGSPQIIINTSYGNITIKQHSAALIAEKLPAEKKL